VRWPPAWELVQCREWKICFVDLVRELQFSRELLLLEAGRWGTGIVREPTVRGTSTVEAVTRQRLAKTQQIEKT
jgi:hypothetical protein